jgi:hypothetical protein
MRRFAVIPNSVLLGVFFEQDEQDKQDEAPRSSVAFVLSVVKLK